MNTVRKVCIIGEGGSGKTNLTNLLMSRPFDGKYIRTLGVEVEILQTDGKTFNIWDCAGHPQCMGLSEGYYVESHVCILTCDLSSDYGMESLSFWVQKYRSVCPDAPIIICGTKCDIAKENARESLFTFGNAHNIPFLFTSAKSGYDVDSLLTFLKNI